MLKSILFFGSIATIVILIALATFSLNFEDLQIDSIPVDAYTYSTPHPIVQAVPLS